MRTKRQKTKLHEYKFHQFNNFGLNQVKDKAVLEHTVFYNTILNMFTHKSTEKQFIS